jgi:dTMP kinase
MAPEASQKLMFLRYSGDEAKKDIHERNVDYLLHCRKAALFAAKKLGWQVIKCSDENNDPLAVNAVSEMVISAAQGMIDRKGC